MGTHFQLLYETYNSQLVPSLVRNKILNTLIIELNSIFRVFFIKNYDEAAIFLGGVYICPLQLYVVLV